MGRKSTDAKSFENEDDVGSYARRRTIQLDGKDFNELHPDSDPYDLHSWGDNSNVENGAKTPVNEQANVADSVATTPDSMWSRQMVKQSSDLFSDALFADTPENNKTTSCNVDNQTLQNAASLTEQSTNKETLSTTPVEQFNKGN